MSPKRAATYEPTRCKPLQFSNMELVMLPRTRTNEDFLFSRTQEVIACSCCCPCMQGILLLLRSSTYSQLAIPLSTSSPRQQISSLLLQSLQLYMTIMAMPQLSHVKGPITARPLSKCTINLLALPCMESLEVWPSSSIFLLAQSVVRSRLC